MQTLDCHLGLWKACATVEEMAHDQLMAVISVWDREDGEKINSRHIVVFDQQLGTDASSQAYAVVQKLLFSRYSA